MQAECQISDSYEKTRFLHFVNREKTEKKAFTTIVSVISLRCKLVLFYVPLQWNAEHYLIALFPFFLMSSLF